MDSLLFSLSHCRILPPLHLSLPLPAPEQPPLRFDHSQNAVLLSQLAALPFKVGSCQMDYFLFYLVSHSASGLAVTEDILFCAPGARDQYTQHMLHLHHPHGRRSAVQVSDKIRFPIMMAKPV